MCEFETLKCGFDSLRLKSCHDNDPCVSWTFHFLKEFFQEGFFRPVEFAGNWSVFSFGFPLFFFLPCEFDRSYELSYVLSFFSYVDLSGGDFFFSCREVKLEGNPATPPLYDLSS